jgi:hypothetical protein
MDNQAAKKEKAAETGRFFRAGGVSRFFGDPQHPTRVLGFSPDLRRRRSDGLISAPFDETAKECPWPVT